MKSRYVKIKLLSNRARGFYLLMTTGTTFSHEKDVFICERASLKYLDQEYIQYEVIE